MKRTLESSSLGGPAKGLLVDALQHPGASPCNGFADAGMSQASFCLACLARGKTPALKPARRTMMHPLERSHYSLDVDPYLIV
jgi:hypothetical protein